MLIKEFVTEDNPILLSLVSQDQIERQKYQQFVKTKAKGNWDQGAKLYAQMYKRDPNDLFGDKQRLNKFAKMKFNFSTFSKSDWNNYWLLSQHLDWNRPFQKKALNIILKYLGKDSEEYKYLHDRIQCGQSGTQTFGTQDICNKD